MIYVAHDFYMNLSQAVNSNDERLIKDIFRHELSTLIGKERKELRKLYDVCGISYPKGASNEVLTKSVLGNIRKRDKRFTTGISVLIARQEGLLNVVEKDKERSGEDAQIEKQKSSDIVTRISYTLGLFFENMSKEEYVKFRNSVLKRVNNINKKYSSAAGGVSRPTQSQLDLEKKHKRKKMIMVGVGIGVLVLGYIAYKKGWLAQFGIGAKKMADGGAIGSGNASMPVQPSAPVSPSPTPNAAPAPAPVQSVPVDVPVASSTVGVANGV